MNIDLLRVSVQVVMLMLMTFLTMDECRKRPWTLGAWVMVSICGVGYTIFILMELLPQFLETFGA